MNLRQRLAQLDRYESDEVRLIKESKLSEMEKIAEIHSTSARYEILRHEARAKYGV